MAVDVDEFFDDFDHYTREVSLARHQDFSRVLRQWFQTFEVAREPLLSRIRWLRDLLPEGKLENDIIVQGRGMAGSGKLNWPDNLEHRLSGQLQLLETLTEREDSAWQFARGFFPGGSRDLNSMLAQLVRHLFEPHARELRRYLERNADKPVIETQADEIPASNRIVRIDHNSQGYSDADGALTDVETKLQQVNEGDPDDKERAIAEISASRRLLQATKVRVGALAALLGTTLIWIASQFAETAVGKAAEWAIQKLIEYLPILAGLI